MIGRHVAQLGEHISHDKRWFESTQGNLAFRIEPVINAYPWREKRKMTVPTIVGSAPTHGFIILREVSL